MNTIEKLNRLSEMQAQVDVIKMHYDQVRVEIMTPEIRQALADVDAEERTALEALQSGIDGVTSEIKNEVTALGETVRGEHLMAVWSKGRVSWDIKAIEGYAAAHPEILPWRKEGAPSVSIRGMK